MPGFFLGSFGRHFRRTTPSFSFRNRLASVIDASPAITMRKRSLPFGADRYFPLFRKAPETPARNGAETAAACEREANLRAISAAKPRTVGLSSGSQRRKSRRLKLPGWGARIRTSEWRYQKPLPYHLATPQQRERTLTQFAYRTQQGPLQSCACPGKSFWRTRGAGFTGDFRPPGHIAFPDQSRYSRAPSEYSSAW